jgi:hypothetical protein
MATDRYDDTPRPRSGISLAKGPVALVGLASLALGVLGFIFASRSWDFNAPSGTVNGTTFIGIEGNGWTWLLFGGTGLVLLLSAPMHWSAKTMAMLGGIVMAIACALAIVDGDVLGIFAANSWTMLAFGAAAVALLLVALLPRVGRRKETVVEEDRTTATAPNGRFERDGERVDEPVGTTDHAPSGTRRRV